MRRIPPLERIRLLDRAGLDVVAALNRSALFPGHTLSSRRTPGTGLHLLVRRLYPVGVLSLVIIIVSGLLIGMVLALQDCNILTSYDSRQAVGQTAALILLRGLGPVTTNLLFAGHAGPAFTAEIGNMRATEQLSSLETTDVDLLKYIVVSHLQAGFISMPLLAVIFDMVGIRGGTMVVVDWPGIYEGSFWANMQNNVQPIEDVLDGMVKSIVLTLAVAQITIYQGCDYEPIPEGINRAATRAVVYISLAVLGLDFILTALMFGDF